MFCEIPWFYFHVEPRNTRNSFSRGEVEKWRLAVKVLHGTPEWRSGIRCADIAVQCCVGMLCFESAENAGRRLAAMLAPHSLCPRHTRQSLDCLRWRVLRVCSTITAPSALFPGISRGCTWRSVRRQFRSSRFCRIRFNRAIRSAWHLRHLALRRCASLCNISASAQADSACAERNAPSLASAALPPRFTQATAPHARSLPYSTCWRIAYAYHPSNISH